MSDVARGSMPGSAAALVIHSECASPALLELIDSLPADAFTTVIVVDDGGGAAGIDAGLRDRGVLLVRHAVHVGRGAAIRAGVHAALIEAPGIDRIVVASESDAAADILDVAAHQDAVVLGRRGNSRPDPALLVLAGIAAAEPWSPLRSIPASLAPLLLALESRGAEFDLQTLILARENSIPIREVPISQQAAAAGGSFGAVARFLAAVRPERANTRLLAGLCLLVLAAFAALTTYGFATGHLFKQFLWLPWGLHRLVHFGALFAGWSAPILLMFPWTYAGVFAVLLAAGTMLAEGPSAVTAVLFFLLSANTLGAACVRRMPGKSGSSGSDVINTLFGVGIYALAMTLTARLPVNYPATWIVVLAAPIAFDFRSVAHRMRRWLDGLRSIELPNWRERGALALLLFVLTIHWFAALGPESSADGLTMHLAAILDIGAHHALTFHPDAFVWSVMPMAADFTYSIVNLLGREASASLLNFTMLALLVALIFRAARGWLPRDAALVVAALFASTPLVNLVTGSLFIENFVAAMILATALELWHFRETGEPRALWLAAALGGTAASAKFGALAFLAVALFLAARELRRRSAPRLALGAAALLLLFATPPYAIALVETGNPVFPFLNARFPSSLLEHGVEFHNSQFTQALAWKTPFDLTFHTRQYLEGLNGALGFQYLLLIPLAAIALFAARNYGARIAAGIGLIAGAAVMVSQPYARYIYPALPLITLPFAALAGRFAPRQHRLYIALLGASLVCIALNVYFTPASGWYHKDFYAPAIFRRGGREQVMRQDIPLRDVTIRFRQAHPQEHVMLLVEPDLADAGSTAYEYHWHQYRVWKQIARAESVIVLRRTFANLGVRYFISRRPGPDDDLLAPWSLAEFLANCTRPIIENGRFFAAQTLPECETLDDAGLKSRLDRLPPALVSPGMYDDFDLALRFHGAWTRSMAFDGPYRHSVSYSDSAGAEAEFAFEGTSLTYMFTRTFNRGIALLEIDGAPREIDLYAPKTEWQSSEELCCFAPGRHLAVLRASGRKNAESKGFYIDLDAFVAR